MKYRYLSMIFLSFSVEILASTSSSYELDTVVVTGSRTSKLLQDTPVKTEVISSERIKEQNYSNVSQAILDISGVTLQGMRGKEGSTAIMQGLAEEHVLVLIDSVPVLQTSSNGVDLSDLSTLNIKQIEVIKGGASAIYGGQAMGGVINIITHDPKKIKSKFRIERDAALAGDQSEDPGYTNLMLSNEGKYKKLSYGLNLTHDKNRSIDRDIETLSRDTGDTDKFIFNTRLKYDLRKNINIEARYNRFQENHTTYGAKLLPSSEYSQALDNSDIIGEKLRLSLKHKVNSGFDYIVHLSQDRVEDELALQDDVSTDFIESFKTSTFIENRLETQANFVASDSHLLTGGFVTKSTSLDQSNRIQLSEDGGAENSDVDDKSSYTNEAYLQDDWFINNSEIITGLRVTKDQYFDENISPKISYLYNYTQGKNKHALRVAMGTGYRIPSLKERFYVLDHRSLAGYVVYGNEELTPETSTSFQIGYDLTRNQNYAFNLSLYRNDVKNLILATEQNDNSDDITFIYENVSAVEITGYELGASVNLPKSVELAGSFNHTKAVNKETGLIIPNRPFYTGQVSLKHRFYKEKMSSIYLLRHFGESYANETNTKGFVGYQQLDWKLNLYEKSYQAFLGIRNIFDVKRDALIDTVDPIYDQRPVLGRTFYVGVQYEI